MKFYNKNYSSNIGFIDILFNIMFCFVVLWVLAVITPDIPKPTNMLDPKSTYIVSMEWNEGSIADIDLHIKGPDDQVLNFMHKETGYMHLERDDLGRTNDVVFYNGEVIISPVNSEIAFITSPLEGHWVVNAYYYSDNITAGVIDVTMKLISIENFSIVATRTFQLKKKWSQFTAFSFSMDDKGQVTTIDMEEQIPFIAMKRGVGVIE